MANETDMLMMAPKTQTADIVAELERLLLDRQALVHRLEALSPQERKTRTAARAEIYDALERIVARQTLLLEELAVLHPPAASADA